MVSSIRNKFLTMWKNQEFNEEGMLEIVGASFIADEEVIFGKVNHEYVQKEIAWYTSQSLRVADLEDTPKIWKAIASSKGLINSNYGWCIYSKENGLQYQNVLKKLLENTNTRQATMIYNRPSMHEDAIYDGMKDFMCTNAVTYRMVKGRLNATVQMRSNDVVFGYKNDYAWQKYVLDELCRELRVLPGAIVWQAASLHIYPRHFKILDDFIMLGCRSED